jgi:hypothetical protein
VSGLAAVTETVDSYAVRVMVTDAWDHVALSVSPRTTVTSLKREALARTLTRARAPLDGYSVKFGGALVLDESATLEAIGAGPNAALIVLPSRRRPVL